MKKIIQSTPATQGYTQAQRRRVVFEDGSKAFVKTAVDEDTETWLRTEYTMYRALEGAPFLAKLLGWHDPEDDYPSLILEDLGHATWPPAWPEGSIDRVLDTIDIIANHDRPDTLPCLSKKTISFRSWRRIEDNPEHFLSLQLCTEAWLVKNLPTLLEAQETPPLEGDALLHLDMRSDNICFDGDRTIVIDWNWCHVGNPLFDIAFFLPSLSTETGLPPETWWNHGPEYAACVSGFFASQAGKPDIPHAPFVRTIQKKQLSSSLPWAIRGLGLSPLDGPRTMEDLLS